MTAVSTSSSALQAPPELLSWMRTFGFTSRATARVASLTFDADAAPTLAKAEANAQALQSVLHMPQTQVRVSSMNALLTWLPGSTQVLGHQVAQMHAVTVSLTL